MNEQIALKLCLIDHDPRGFEFLVKKYRREAYYHAYALLGNQEDAFDACQESFTRAFASLPVLKSLPAFYPWFYTILRNCCLNMLKKRKHIKNYIHNTLRDKTKRYSHENQFTELAKKEQQNVVWDVLIKLSPDNREILIMKYFHGNRYSDISTTLGIPRGTVMSRLYYARKSFREEYEKQVNINKGRKQ